MHVAFAAVGIYVSKDSPRKSISVSELRDIFSSDSKQDQSLNISRFGQVSHPYLAGYFKQKVLLQKDYSELVQETASPQAL